MTVFLECQQTAQLPHAKLAVNSLSDETCSGGLNQSCSLDEMISIKKKYIRPDAKGYSVYRVLGLMINFKPIFNFPFSILISDFCGSISPSTWTLSHIVLSHLSLFLSRSEGAV